MQVISIEDARRVFIATLKLVYKNDSDRKHTYALSKSRERSNLKNNEDDVVLIPSKYFNNCLKVIVEQLGLHKEQANAYKTVFGELGWIIRPRDIDHRYKSSFIDRRKFHGKDATVYLIDRVKFEMLSKMNGVTLKGDSGQTLLVSLKNPDGDIIYDEHDRPKLTSVTYGLVQDARYNSVNKFLDAKIAEKDA